MNGFRKVNVVPNIHMNVEPAGLAPFLDKRFVSKSAHVASAVKEPGTIPGHISGVTADRRESVKAADRIIYADRVVNLLSRRFLLAWRTDGVWYVSDAAYWNSLKKYQRVLAGAAEIVNASR